MENQKNKIRSLMKARLLALSSSRRQEAALALLNTFAKPEGLVLSYSSFGDELETEALNSQLAQSNKLVLPKMEGEHLHLYLVHSLQDLMQNSFGILEPNPILCKQVSLSQIPTILIPALSFDQFNHRLGYGKGYYDRLLMGGSFPSIGVGYREQLFETPLPVTSLDVKLKQVMLF